MKSVVVALASPALFLAGQAAAQTTAQTTAPAATQTPRVDAPRAAPAKPAPEQDPGGKTVGEVVVSGTQPDVRTSIDRTSYNIAKDLQTTAGSIGDALRNVPSVQVDVQGNVSLRGDGNVTIMIDGKPSGMFKGEGRGAALQALAADQFERVEVITNPSAAFNPEGGAGIINLISKKARKPGYSGSVRANLGSEGRKNFGVSGAYNSPKLGLSGDLNYREDVQKFDSYDQREIIDPATGSELDSFGQFRQRGQGHIWNGRGSLDYDLDDANRLSAELRYIEMSVSTDMYETYRAWTNGGPITRAYQRLARNDFSRSNGEASASWRRKFAGDDHVLTVNASYEVTEFDGDRDGTLQLITPPAASSPEVLDSLTRLRQSEVKADYSRPMPAEGKLKAGYLFQFDDNSYDNFGVRGALNPDPSITNLFLYEQTIHQAYATYEQPLGDWTVLAGLRAETVAIDLDQVTSAVTASNDYSRVYPSLHLAYKLSDETRLSASYSRRVQRPSAQDLNPYRVYLSPTDYRQGNPYLEPQETDSFEAAWQRRHQGTFYQATAYYRQSRHGFTDVIRDLGNGVFLTTKENLGASRFGGVEVVANGRFTPKLTYNVSGSAYWTEIDASGLGFADKRSGTSWNARGNLNWQVTPKDFFQANAFMNGPRILPQGEMKGFGIVNLGYRRKFSESLFGVVTWQDALQTLGNEMVLDTPTLRQRQVFRGNARAVFVGLTWTFGGNGQKARPPAFDFGGGGGPGD